MRANVSARRARIAVVIAAATVLAACTGHSSHAAKAGKGECGLTPSPITGVHTSAAAALKLSVNATGHRRVNAYVQGAQFVFPAETNGDTFVSTDDHLARLTTDGKVLWSLGGDIGSDSWAPSGHDVLIKTADAALAVVDAQTGKVLSCASAQGIVDVLDNDEAVPILGQAFPENGNVQVASDYVATTKSISVDSGATSNTTVLERMGLIDVTSSAGQGSEPEFEPAAVLLGGWNLLAISTATTDTDGFEVLGGAQTNSQHYTQLAFTGVPDGIGKTTDSPPRVQNTDPNASTESFDYAVSVRDYSAPVAPRPAADATATWDGLTVLGTDHGVTLVRDQFVANGHATEGGVAALDRQGDVLWTAPAPSYAAIANGQVLVATASAGALTLTARNSYSGATIASTVLTDAGISPSAYDLMLVSVAGLDVWLTNSKVAVDVSLDSADELNPITVQAPSNGFESVRIATSGAVALETLGGAGADAFYDIGPSSN